MRWSLLYSLSCKGSCWSKYWELLSLTDLLYVWKIWHRNPICTFYYFKKSVKSDSVQEEQLSVSSVQYSSSSPATLWQLLSLPSLPLYSPCWTSVKVCYCSLLTDLIPVWACRGTFFQRWNTTSLLVMSKHTVCVFAGDIIMTTPLNKTAALSTHPILIYSPLFLF